MLWINVKYLYSLALTEKEKKIDTKERARIIEVRLYILILRIFILYNEFMRIKHITDDQNPKTIIHRCNLKIKIISRQHFT